MDLPLQASSPKTPKGQPLLAFFLPNRADL